MLNFFARSAPRSRKSTGSVSRESFAETRSLPFQPFFLLPVHFQIPRPFQGEGKRAWRARVRAIVSRARRAHVACVIPRAAYLGATWRKAGNASDTGNRERRPSVRLYVPPRRWLWKPNPECRTARPDGEKTRGGEDHTVNGLKSVLRWRLERRARDCARNVRPSRAANNDPHPRAPGALALSLSGRGIWKLKQRRASCARLS